MSLNDDLAKLGLKPLEVPEDDSISADDAIREIMHEAFWKHDKFGAEEAFDACRQLELEAARLRRALAKSGVGAITTEDFIPEPLTRSSWGHKDCDHPQVKVALEDNLLRCRDCDKSVNPIWWITRHAAALRKSEDWLTHLKKERRNIQAEIETLKKERAKHRAAVRRKDKK